MSLTIDAGSAIRPFHIDIPQAELDELRRRIVATRWPTKELVDDRSQGVQLATVQALASYWTTDYDWRRLEAELNALPQFVTEIDGLDIHFIHVRSTHEGALPLIMTHGWPGSVVELLELDRPADGPHCARRARRGRLPSCAPVAARVRLLGRADGARLGHRAHRAAWDTLMHRLGYDRYVAQGGDVGAAVTDTMGARRQTGSLAST